MPETHDPKPDDPKPDDPQGTQRADVELARAQERIKSANEELARLDRLVSGLERGDSPPTRQEGAGAEPSDATVDKAATPESNAPHPSLSGKRLMRGGLVSLLLAMGILGAAFAARYGYEARRAPPISIASPEASGLRDPAKSPTVQVADASGQPPPPAPPSRKDSDGIPSTGATPSAEPTSADLAQSLKTIAHDLASINEKLEQLKSSHERALRDHADAIQQLRTAQEQSARDNAGITEQVQALQTQLAVLSAKSSGRSLMKENDVAVRQHVQAAAPRRPRRPRAPWMPPPDMVEPWGYPDW